jgi:hypothetical protein
MTLPADVTIRLDCAGDASRLYQLAALSGRQLAPGPFAVADVDGRIRAAVPLGGGPALRDPSEARVELEMLLERFCEPLAPIR